MLRRLDDDEVSEMRNMAADGATRTELTERFGVCATTVSLICHGHIYDHVDGPLVERMAPTTIKLTADQRDEIRRRYASGNTSLSRLAREYDVDPSYISKIKNGIR